MRLFLILFIVSVKWSFMSTSLFIPCFVFPMSIIPFLKSVSGYLILAISPFRSPIASLTQRVSAGLYTGNSNVIASAEIRQYVFMVVSFLKKVNLTLSDFHA